MAKVKELTCKSLGRFVELVETFRSDVGRPLWFRGCGRADFPLLPSLYRHRTKKKVADLAILESQLITRFHQRSIPFHDRQLTDEWDTLFFMQHYGVPTRLLDWTENPFMGLHFAVMACPHTHSKTRTPRFTASASVWVLEPVAWNRHSLAHQSFDGGVLVPGDDPLKGYKPVPAYAGMFNHPVALYGAHNSPRIVAQRGVFTLFGQNTKAMEGIYDSEGFPDTCLWKLTIPEEVVADVRAAILGYGITESVVFPDLDGLAREIRRSFGFEV